VVGPRGAHPGLRLQGVADIADNALLVRFKFTAKPGNPAAIQREAVKRMFSVFPAMGIEFAKEGAAVVVHAAPALPAEVAPAPAAETKETPALAAASDWAWRACCSSWC
jgi:moderate conductance mechanosensitive channel